MIKNTKLIVLVLFSTSQFAMAQALIPATSEDQEAFDQQLEQAANGAQVKADAVKPTTRKSNFGAIVKEEAKKLKDASLEAKKEMGQLISKQKRKNQNPIPAGAASGSGNSSSANNDGRNSSPKFNNAGGAPGSPGQSGNHRKLK